MFNFIYLWLGRGIIGAILVIISGYIVAHILRLILILLRKPWYCFRKLLPGFWFTEKEWRNYEKLVHKYKNSKNLAPIDEWKRSVYLIRKGQFGNIYIPEKQNWWDAKNHFVYIKKNKKE